MSSMRNAIQRRNHRERAQPQEREKWGLLEKHKDYSKRAKAFNGKKEKLRALRQKVLEKNPDEFYFGMMSQKAGGATGRNKDGTLSGDRGAKVLSQEAVRLYKTQDLGYVRTARNTAAKEAEELRKRVVVGLRGSGGSGGTRTVFAEDEDDREGKLAEKRAREQRRDAELQTAELRSLERAQTAQMEKLQARLAVAEERVRVLTEAEEALDLQRAKMAKSPTVGGVTKSGKKFKIRERKR